MFKEGQAKFAPIRRSISHRIRKTSQLAQEGFVDSAQQLWLDQIRSVLETLNQGIIVNDSSRRIVFANSIFLDMVRMDAEHLLGHCVTDLYPPEDVPKLLEFIGRREAQGRARYEFYIPQPGGARLPVVVTSRQIQDPHGTLFAVVTATDISEQKRAETDLREANALLLARQRQIEEELLLAERVQQSLAPRNLQWGSVSVETFYQPVRSIGGDYGLVIPGEDYLDILVCDVSGHGISSALVANRIYSETLAQIERGVELTSMMKHLNHFVLQNLSGSAFYFTMAAARFNRTCRSLQFAGAGHPPAMIVRRGQMPQFLESKSMILGLFEDAVDPDATIETAVGAGDRLILYTDGLTENFNSRHQMLGIDGLREIFREVSGLSLIEMKQEILDRVAAWRSGPAADDVSLVVLELS
jgi:PAS domain S-box-containing protein